MAAKFPCASPPALCDQQPNPLTAFSSELDDSTTFLSAAWSPSPPLLNKNFNVYPCVAFAESQTSQSESDLAAARGAVVCSNPCSDVFSNSAQTAQFTCPNGSLATFTTPAGQFAALNQLTADREAFTVASAMVTAHPVCLGSLTAVTVCLGLFSEVDLVAKAADTPLKFSIIHGSLPPGITMISNPSSASFLGVPTQTGLFTFTVQAVNPLGVVTSRDLSISVVTIATSSGLPDAFFNTPYSVSLTLINPGNSPVVWEVVSGSLPVGLSLNSNTGVINGTPSGGGGLSSFTIGAQVDGGLCTKAFTINAQFINWDLMVWSNVLVVPGGGAGGQAVGNFVGRNFTVAGRGNGAPSAKVEALGTLVYSGPTVNCKVTVVVTSTNNPMGFFIFQDAVQLITINSAALTPGTHVFNFTVTATAGSSIQFRGLTDISDPARLWVFGSDGVSLGSYTGTIANA